MSHHVKVRIRVRILADSVNTGILYPPDTALNQISSYMAVPLVEIWHNLAEPTVNCYFLFVIRSIRV